LFEPTVRLLSVTDAFEQTPIDLIEYAGRVDYGPASRAKMGDKTVIKRWIDSGHQSMIEMVDAAFEITCSRVVSHELVRHRIASFQQESQRYVKYDEEAADDLFFIPPELSQTEALIVKHAYEDALVAYKKLKILGVKSQMARYVLPNGTRTRIIMKANLREWMHFCKLRCHSSAQPEMQIIANDILDRLYYMYPEVFDSVVQEVEDGNRAIR